MRAAGEHGHVLHVHVHKQASAGTRFQQPLGTDTCPPQRAIVIEDVREACIELRRKGYQCDRVTHNELMALTGQGYTGSLLKGEYARLWISTPSD
eukprot:8157179-Lingulodinium_polyedra.AAC.1